MTTQSHKCPGAGGSSLQVYRVEEVSELLGLGLNQTYAGIARKGEIPSVRR